MSITTTAPVNLVNGLAHFLSNNPVLLMFIVIMIIFIYVVILLFKEGVL